MTKKRVFNWIIMILWIVIIFVMSNQPGDVSSNQSELVLKIFKAIGIDLNMYWGELATLIIRKLAHFTEYLILYILVYNAINSVKSIRKNLFIAIIITCIYAITDEVHQYFIPGRVMSIKDILIDSLGGLLGCMLLYVYERIKK